MKNLALPSPTTPSQALPSHAMPGPAAPCPAPLDQLQRARYRLIIRSEPSPVPNDIRLKHLLKVLGRWFGFRCEEVSELPADLPYKTSVAGGWPPSTP